MPKLQPYIGDYYLWNYVPSMAAAIVFISLFTVMTGLHLWQLLKTHSPFCWPFVIGGLFEVLGYCSRAVSVNLTGQLVPYTLQAFFLLVAPALYAASIYMVLGRIMRSTKGEHYSFVRIDRLTKIFVLGDIASFGVQGSSSGLMFHQNLIQIGEDIVIAGLLIQLVSFALFFLNAILFQVRMRKEPTRESLDTQVPWKSALYMLYAVSGLILLRSIFRVVEYIEGNSGYSLKHEWTLSTFDAVPMFLVMVVFYFWHPSALAAPTMDGESSPALSTQYYSEIPMASGRRK